MSKAKNFTKPPQAAFYIPGQNGANKVHIEFRYDPEEDFEDSMQNDDQICNSPAVVVVRNGVQSTSGK